MGFGNNNWALADKTENCLVAERKLVAMIDMDKIVGKLVRIVEKKNQDSVEIDRCKASAAPYYSIHFSHLV